jgi:hypothetical protein
MASTEKAKLFEVTMVAPSDDVMVDLSAAE